MNLELISRYPAPGAHTKPLLFVHGAWHGAWCWDRNILPYFARHGYAAHALSLRGHGGSEGKNTLFRTRIAHYVEDILAVAETLPEPPVVIGHSLGGFVVQKYLERYSAPAGILLASAPPRGMYRALLRLAVHHPVSFFKSNITMSTKALVNTPKLAREVLFSRNTPEAVILDCLNQLTEEAMPAFFDILLLDHPRTARVTAPVMVIGSTGDSFFSAREIDATAKAYNTRASYFESMGHDIMLEEGWQDVADSMLFWLNNKIFPQFSK
jgi:pimeloyl-ACP methyl ester carboxylesterase